MLRILLAADTPTTHTQGQLMTYILGHVRLMSPTLEQLLELHQLVGSGQ